MVSRREIEVGASPEAVWAVLADPRLYAAWVVGASDVRGVDGAWPQVGATLHHTQGLLLDDATEVVESEAPRRLRLRAAARPLVVADVELELAPTRGGTRVTLAERAVGGAAARLPAALVDPAIGLRNAAALKRLRHLAELGPPG